MCVCVCMYVYMYVYIYIVDPHYLWASYLQIWASLEAQLVKNPPAMRETWVSPWFRRIPWKRERLPTPVFWPGEFHRLYSPWGHKESDVTEWLSLSFIITWKFLYSLKLFVATKSALAVLLQSFIDMNRVWKIWVIQCTLSSGCWPSDALPSCSSQIANKCHFHSV